MWTEVFGSKVLRSPTSPTSGTTSPCKCLWSLIRTTIQVGIETSFTLTCINLLYLGIYEVFFFEVEADSLDTGKPESSLLLCLYVKLLSCNQISCYMHNALVLSGTIVLRFLLVQLEPKPQVSKRTHKHNKSIKSFTNSLIMFISSLDYQLTSHWRRFSLN